MFSLYAQENNLLSSPIYSNEIKTSYFMIKIIQQKEKNDQKNLKINEFYSLNCRYVR